MCHYSRVECESPAAIVIRARCQARWQATWHEPRGVKGGPDLQNLRLYGQPPFTVAVLHGGPGAPGTMAPVARELAAEWGVLEPLQTADSLDGQVEELRAALGERADLPVTLIGSSWGAMLGYIFAARYPAHVRRLIFVGSGVYEARHPARIEQTRPRPPRPAARARAPAPPERLG